MCTLAISLTNRLHDGVHPGCLPDCDRLSEVLSSRPYPPSGIQYVCKLAIMCFDYCMDKKDVLYIAQNCKELHAIITQCKLATDEIIIDILRHAELSSISWSWLSVTCRNMHSLNVTISDISYVDIFRISTESPSITQFVLKYCDKITDAAIANIANKCPHLRHVSLKGCREITSKTLRKTFRKDDGSIGKLVDKLNFPSNNRLKEYHVHIIVVPPSKGNLIEEKFNHFVMKTEFNHYLKRIEANGLSSFDEKDEEIIITSLDSVDINKNIILTLHISRISGSESRGRKIRRKEYFGGIFASLFPKNLRVDSEKLGLIVVYPSEDRFNVEFPQLLK
ncbi:F-box/LRR-repeat protein 20-like isoform X5 [Rhizophagus clarus]|uniref:F-box/LRR-repeat protein 20-like isoform X5 n=1 Tax=Rhizophagus clarus TaxID=94130 RepID=A0A8H3LTU9_9GLOM|nr:F-box/LRR-repeat protein 20-like isoform X5 [Rhizophagus clarus]